MASLSQSVKFALLESAVASKNLWGLDLFKLGGPSVKNHPVVCPQDYGLFITDLELPYLLDEIADGLRYYQDICVQDQDM